MAKGAWWCLWRWREVHGLEGLEVEWIDLLRRKVLGSLTLWVTFHAVTSSPWLISSKASLAAQERCLLQELELEQELAFQGELGGSVRGNGSPLI